MSEGDDDRRSQLLQLKLGAYIDAALSSDAGVVAGSPQANGDLHQRGFPQGAIRHDSVVAYLLVDDPHERSLGPVLLWAARAGIRRAVVFLDDGEIAGRLARQCRDFTLDISVWMVSDDTAEVVEPAPYPPAPTPPTGAELDCATTFSDHGLDVSIEWGVPRGELLGLEVGRVVAEPTPHVETGVGDFDREISNMMRAGQTPEAAVASVVEMLHQYRQADAPPHPMRDLVVERWIRSLVIAEPSLIGCGELAPADLTLERVDLRSNLPAAAIGSDSDGVGVLVVCTAGLDVDLIPLTLDTLGMWRHRGSHIDRLLIVGDPRSFIEPQRLVAEWASTEIEFVEFQAPNRN